MLISVSTARMISEVEPPAAQAGHPAEDRADHDVDRHRPEADHQRRPRAMDHPRPDVAPGPVRAEAVLRARWLADGLDVGGEGLAGDDVREDGQEHDDRQDDHADDGQPVAQEATQRGPAGRVRARRPRPGIGDDVSFARSRRILGSARAYVISTRMFVTSTAVPMTRTTPIISAGSRSLAARTASWPIPARRRSAR